MSEPEIFSFDELEFTEPPTLLLGNGFSMSFSTSFGYRSLFQEFIAHTEEDIFFKALDTVNFEDILKLLTDALRVNSLLEIESIIPNLIQELKDGLIASVRTIHPGKYEFNQKRLKRIASLLSNNFGSIFTLNYDLILYYIIMKAKEMRESKEITSTIIIQDCFSGGEDWMNYTIWKDWNNSGGYKRIHYLHGCLFIREEGYNVVKLKYNEDADILTGVYQLMEYGKFPIFVTEGSSLEKLTKIKKNQYLNWCYGEFRKECVYSKKPVDIVLYGCSMSIQDKHIWDIINQSNHLQNVYISVHSSQLPEKTDINVYRDGLNAIKKQYDSVLHRKDVYLYDSDSLFF